MLGAVGSELRAARGCPRTSQRQVGQWSEPAALMRSVGESLQTYSETYTLGLTLHCMKLDLDRVWMLWLVVVARGMCGGEVAQTGLVEAGC